MASVGIVFFPGLFVVLLLQFFYVTAAPYKQYNVTDIVGGHIAKKGEYPYQISFRWRKEEDPHICGGSIIDQTHVLTAAHCCNVIPHGELNQFYIGAGVTNKSDTKHIVVKRIQKFIIHEHFNVDTFENDICLIKIKGLFNFNKLVKPISLNPKPGVEHIKCSISGWGQWDIANLTLPDPLKGAIVPIANQKECVLHYEDFKEVYPNLMVCAGYAKGGTDSCQGDSGGPLVCKKKLTGIVSWGRGCAEAKYPGIYTRVDKYIHWIKKHGVQINENHLY